jgi:hypothetical protein
LFLKLYRFSPSFIFGDTGRYGAELKFYGRFFYFCRFLARYFMSLSPLILIRIPTMRLGHIQVASKFHMMLPDFLARRTRDSRSSLQCGRQSSRAAVHLR